MKKGAPPKNASILTADGKPFDVPALGSLGLLALGYQGWVAWQDKLKAVKKEMDDGKAAG